MRGAQQAPLPGGGMLPARAAIDAYGNGGFRFAGMSHRGSLLVLPDRTMAWTVTSAAEITAATMAPILDALTAPWFVLLGTGAAQVFPNPDVRRAFLERRIGLEIMTTGAAARTFNVLLAEGRPVAAAFVAV